MPLPLSLIMLAVGLFLSRRGRQSKVGRSLILASFAWLLVASNQAFSQLLLYPLEHRIAAIPEINSPAEIPAELADCTAVMVLGSGHADDPSLASSTKLCEAGLSRLVEGVRIARLLPQATLITSGSSQKAIPHGLVLSQSAQSLGFDAKRIQVIDSVNDTHDEALAAKRLVKKGKIALVTSAFHMPRAMALFKKEGIEVVPCPTDIRCKDSVDLGFCGLTFDAESLSRTSTALHEYLGSLWIKLRGQG